MRKICEPAGPDDSAEGLPDFLPDFLPGRLSVGPGSSADYAGLSAFHYVAGPPATWAAVRVVRYHAPGRGDARCDACRDRVVAVGVLSWPTVRSRGRERHFGLAGWRYGELARFANANLRTVSRVVVHPQFRAVGLASAVIRSLIGACPTRYVEASARMGRAVPMFDRCGMTRLDPSDPCGPVYYVLDREADAPAPPSPSGRGTGGTPPG